MNSKLILLALFVSLSFGCRGIQSELQRAQLNSAASTAAVDGTVLRLEPDLRGMSGSLLGKVHLIAESGVFPAGTTITSMSLRPSATGYYVINFRPRNGVWENTDGNFFGTTKSSKDRRTIDFAWNRGVGSRTINFAAYDVSVTVRDSHGKVHRLGITEAHIN